MDCHLTGEQLPAKCGESLQFVSQLLQTGNIFPDYVRGNQGGQPYPIWGYSTPFRPFVPHRKLYLWVTRICNPFWVFPVHNSGGNSTFSYPRVFKASVKMHRACLRTLAWNFSCFFHTKEKKIFSITVFPLILGQPITSQSN